MEACMRGDSTDSASAGYRQTALLVAFIVGAVAVANLNVLSAGFVWDDRALITDNVLIKHWHTLPQLFTAPFLGMYYRPLVMVSFALEYSLWGLKPLGFHLTNLLIHAANAVLVFVIIREVTRTQRSALLGALLFAVHPAHKGVVVIADRTGVLAALFFLASIAVYMRFRRSPGGVRAPALYAASLVLGGLAFFSKEETIMLPAVVVLIDAVLYGEWLRPFRPARIVRYVPFFALALLYLVVRAHTLGPAVGLMDAFAVEPVRRLMTIPAVLLDYLRLLLLPLHLDYEPRMPVAVSLAEPRILFSLLPFIALLAAAFLARKNRAVAFGTLWYLAVIFPMSNIIPIYPEAADVELFTPIHFLYLPSIGVFLMAGAGIDALLRTETSKARRRSAVATFCCILLFFSALSIERNHLWADEIRFYRYVVEMHPEHHRMRANLGNVYLERNRIDEAVRELEQTVLLAPDIAWYRNSLALAYRAQGRLDRAVAEFKRSVQLDPASANGYVNLSATYRIRGRLADAIAVGRQAVEIAPNSAAAHVNLAIAYKDAGALAEAEKQFDTAIGLDPDSPEAYNGLGIVYAIMGRYDLARNAWERALRIRPDMVEARDNLQRLERMGH
jgi:tetratricopeptide (TPR) repeat protein